MQKYHSLDAIRGIAAVLVLMRHTPGMWPGLYFQSSYLAVDVFFALSGFVIAKSYESGLHAGSLSFSSFVAKRLIRLYPVYLLGAFLIVLASFAGTSGFDNIATNLFSSKDFLLHFLMLPNPAFGYLFPLNGPAWSLFFEIVINLVYAATFMLGRKRVYLEVLFLLLSSAALTVCAFSFGNLDKGFDWDSAHVGFFRTMYCFYMGVFGFRLTQANRFRLRPNSVYLFAILVACLWMPVSKVVRPYYDLLIIMLVFPVPTFVASYCSASVRGGKLYDYLGIVSYPIYILHVPFYLLLTALMNSAGLWFPKRIPAGPLFVVISGAVILLLVKHYDVPLRRWLSTGSTPKVAAETAMPRK